MTKWRGHYKYPGPFGRFKLINGRVYSMVYVLPERLGNLRASPLGEVELLLEGTDYEEVYGIPLSDFINVLLNRDC